jgi:hypothetical protein
MADVLWIIVVMFVFLIGWIFGMMYEAWGEAS